MYDPTTRKPAGTTEVTDRGTKLQYGKDSLIITRFSGHVTILHWSENMGQYVYVGA